jgi:hypothetical protein
MGLDLTAANCVITLTLSPLFTTPQQLQGFAVDDVYTTPEIAPTETKMGVDGVLSGGMVFVPVEQEIMLQANSPSIGFFDQWYLYQISGLSSYSANGTTTLPGLGKQWIMTNGFLVGYVPLPPAKKTLDAQHFRIRWNLSTPVPIG